MGKYEVDVPCWSGDVTVEALNKEQQREQFEAFWRGTSMASHMRALRTAMLAVGWRGTQDRTRALRIASCPCGRTARPTG